MSLKVRIKIRGDKYSKKDMDRFFRSICLDVYRNIIIGTPVDTGRARSNWVLGINALPADSNTQSDPGSYGVPGGKAANNITTANAKLKASESRLRSVFITNSVPYIEALEEGSSKQNSRFVDKAIRRAEALAGLMD